MVNGEKKFARVVLALVCIASVWALESVAQSPTFQDALQTYVNGDLARAEQMLLAVLQDNPDHAQARQILSEIQKDKLSGALSIPAMPPSSVQTAPMPALPMLPAAPGGRGTGGAVGADPVAPAMPQSPLSASLAQQPVTRFGAAEPPDADEPSVYAVDIYGGDVPALLIRINGDFEFFPNKMRSMHTIDLMGVRDRLPVKTGKDVDRGGLKRIRHSQFKTFPIQTARVVLDLQSSGVDVQIEKSPEGLWVRFPGSPLVGAGQAMSGLSSAAALGDTSAPLVPAGPVYALVSLGGSGQSIQAVTAGLPLSVVVLDRNTGLPAANLPVTFSVQEGRVMLVSGSDMRGVVMSVRANDQGQAWVNVMADTQAGATSVKVSAGEPGSIGYAEASFTLTVVNGPASRIWRLTLDPQEGISGDEVKEMVKVKVTDDYGNAVMGSKVRFRVARGNGRLDAIRQNDPQDDVALSDTMGVAACEVWVLGPESDNQTLEAQLLVTDGRQVESLFFTAISRQRLVSLDFKEAQVVDVVRTLAQLGNLNVIFDLITEEGKPIPTEELPPLTVHVVDLPVIDALDAVLESASLTRVTEGNAIRILPKKRAIGRPLPVVSDTPQTGGKFVTHVFELKYTDASNIQKLLIEFVERDGGRIVADPFSNQLMVIQTADNIKKVAEVLEKLDTERARSKDSNLVVQTYDLKFVSASEIADRIAAFINQPNTFEFTVIGSDMTFRKLGLLRIDERQLKKSTGTGRDRVEVDEVQRTLFLNVIVTNSEKNSITVLSTREVVSLVSQLIGELDVKSEFTDLTVQEFRPRFMPIPEAVELVKSFLSDSGTFKVYEEYNGIMVKDVRKNIREIDGALAALDKGVRRLAFYHIRYLDRLDVEKLMNLLIGTTATTRTTTTNSLFSTQRSTETTSSGTNDRWWMIQEYTNTLVIYDAPNTVDMVMRFLQQIEGEENYIRVFKLKHLKPTQASQILQQVLDINLVTGSQTQFLIVSFGGEDKDRSRQGIKKNIIEKPLVFPEDRSATLFVIGKPDIIASVELLLANVDIKLPDGLELKIHDITEMTTLYSTAIDAAGAMNVSLGTEITELINEAISSNGRFFAIAGAGRVYLTVRDFAVNQKDVETLLDTFRKTTDMIFKTYQLKFAQVGDIINALAAFIDNTTVDPMKIFAITSSVPSTNSVVIATTSVNIPKLDKLIERLDMSFPSQPGLEMKVFRLTNTVAQKVEQVLSDIMSDNPTTTGRVFGRAKADLGSNALVIVTSSGNMDMIAKLIESMDVPMPMAPGLVIKSYQLKNITATDAQSLLSAVFTAPKPTGSDFEFAGVVGRIDRSNVIVVSTVVNNISLVDEIVKNIDVPAPPMKDIVTEVFFLRASRPSEIARILRGTYDEYKMTRTGATYQEEMKEVSQSEDFVSGTGSPGSEPGFYARFTADDRLNALTVMAPPAMMREIADLIRKLDIRTPQVLIDARILEYSIDDAQDRGINILTKASVFNAAGGVVAGGGAANALALGAITGGDGKIGTDFSPAQVGAGAYRVILNAGQMRALLEMLDRTSKVEVLATPKIMAMNNQMAEIRSGQTLQIPVTSFNAQGVPATDLRAVSADLLLQITPMISADRGVRLTVNVAINEFSPTQQQGSQINITTRQAVSQVLLGDKQTLVLGGVIRDRKVMTQSGVPLLKEVPVLGNFFKSKSESTEKTELMIFITPHVVESQPEATQISKEVASELQQLTPFAININTSSIGELAELQGLRSDIDPDQHLRLSSRIVQRRTQYGPFQALEQLLMVPGLTRSVFDEIVYRIEFKLDVNVVSLQELVRVKGISLGMAQAVVEERRRRGIFRSEDEFESVILGLGMDRGYYNRFLKPIVAVQAGSVGDMALAAPQVEKLPVAPVQIEPDGGRRGAAPPVPSTGQGWRSPAPVEPSAPVTQQRTVDVVPVTTQRATVSLPPPIQPGVKSPGIPQPSAPGIKTPSAGIKPPDVSGAKSSDAASGPPKVGIAPPPAIGAPKGSDADLGGIESIESVPPIPAAAAGKMDLNSATIDELMDLPGIDEYRAKMIDAYRYTYGKFKTVTDLKQVPDITDEIFEQIKDRVYIAP